MSDSEGYEAVGVTEEGVTVTKRFEAEEFPVPAIAFDVDSERDETVRLVLRDRVPEGVAVEDLGFHPEYGSEYWTIDEDEITFERDIEPRAMYTTVYGIRATGTDNVERYLAEPSIETVDPPRDGGAGADTDVLPDDGEDVVRDVISGEADAVPGVNDDTDEDEEEVEPLDLNDPDNETRETSAEPGGESTEEPVDTAPENLVGALTSQLQAGDGDGADRLRSALDIDDSPGDSVAARVDQIQRDVSNLRAYTDALEEFLDEEGTGEEVLDDVRSEITGLEGTLGDLEETVEAHGSTLDSIESDLAETASDVEELDSSVDSLKSDVEELREVVDDGDLADRLETVETELEALQSWQTQIKQTFGG